MKDLDAIMGPERQPPPKPSVYDMVVGGFLRNLYPALIAPRVLEEPGFTGTALQELKDLPGLGTGIVRPDKNYPK